MGTFLHGIHNLLAFLSAILLIATLFGGEEDCVILLYRYLRAKHRYIHGHARAHTQDCIRDESSGVGLNTFDSQHKGNQNKPWSWTDVSGFWLKQQPGRRGLGCVRAGRSSKMIWR